MGDPLKALKTAADLRKACKESKAASQSAAMLMLPYITDQIDWADKDQQKLTTQTMGTFLGAWVVSLHQLERAIEILEDAEAAFTLMMTTKEEPN
jgi:hypothetical protein